MKKNTLYLALFIVLFSAKSLLAQDINPNDWPTLTGYWKFQNNSNILQATVGNPLVLQGTHQVVAGPVSKDTAVRIGIGSYYKCYHDIAPNGGGDSVNEYSILFDFKILSLNKWHTFYQTDTTNANDGEFFIRPNTGSGPGRIGTATTGYTQDSIIPNKWYRLVLSVKLGHYFRYYLNGNLIHEGDTQDIDDRFSLNPHILLFADNNQEDETIDVASVAIFSSALTSKEISNLGTIDPCILYPFSVSLGKDTILCGSNTIRKSIGPGNYTYQWSTGETDSAVVFSMAKHGNGAKTIWAKKTDINGCFQIDTFKLGIYNAPTVNLGNDINICKGQTVKLTAGSAVNNTYNWRKLPDNYTVSKVNNYTIDSSGTFTVLMQNLFGCTDSDTVLATVHDNSKKPIISATKTSLCTGDTSVISVQNTYTKYLWSNGDTLQSIRIAITKLLSVKTYDAYGCESASSDSIQINAYQNPSAPILRHSSDTSFCNGDSTLVFINETYKDIFWNDAFKGSSRVVKSSQTFTVYIQDANGCFSPISNRINTTAFPVPQKPIIETTLGDYELCPGDSVVIRSKDSSYTYIWSNSSTSRSLTLKTSNKVSLIHRNIHGCLSEASDSFISILYSKPAKPKIQAVGKDSLTCISSDIIYDWVIFGQSGSITTKTIVAEDKKVYFVRTSNGNCWSDYSDSFYFEKTGIFSPKQLNSPFTIYPNPSKEGVFISSKEIVSNSAIIQITNSTGQLCIQESINSEEFINGKYISFEGFDSGIYIIQISTDLTVYTYRILIQ